MKWWLLLAAALTSGCGSLGKPPLPRFAASESARSIPREEGWARELRKADVVYFGLTKSGAADDHPPWRIVEVWQRGGQRVALGWAEIPSVQQPLLEQWQRRELSAQQLLAQLAPPNEREWFRQALRPDLVQVALGAPRELLAKIRAGEALAEEERALLPKDLRPRPDAFDNFIDRVATSSRFRGDDFARLYRAHLLAEQMIAQNIVQFMRDNPGAKLLVFLPDDLMIDPREIADYAAQKISLRQMILDRSHPLPGARRQLLTRTASGASQIVNRSPKSSRHDRRFSAPRLRA